MIEVGKWNTLRVVKEVPFGIYLDGGRFGEILLPSKAVPNETQINDKIEVFLYFDSEDKIIATTKRPHAQVGQFAFLRVIDVNPVGAFLAWGLDKDLLVPRAEQQRPMEVNKSYVVYVKQDNQERIIASSKLNYFLDKTPHQFKAGQEVTLIIDEPTSLGHKVIVNSTHWGLIHAADTFKHLNYGRTMQGYIKAVRDDDKIDVTLRQMGQSGVYDLASRIETKLQEEQGFLALHDKSSALDIKRMFSDSKSNFKRAIGQLYKQGIILIADDGIRLKKKK